MSNSETIIGLRYRSPSGHGKQTLGRVRYRSVVEQVALNWNNITVRAQTQKKGSCCRWNRGTSTKKTILLNVSGQALPGQLMAIIGGSGAGKTTLMNVLTRRNSGNVVVTGRVILNGRKMDNSMANLMAYVQQDDLFLGTLTVREHLTFQALLRMDTYLSYQDRMDRVEDVIHEIGLKKCENTVIGIPGRIKGISGGEKKRLAFASEVLTNPSLLFCDEPTSGLDSFMAESVVSVLKTMAAAGRTIVCTIHQPSSEVFQMFDHLLLMAEGRVAYLGKSSSAIDFFSSQGLQCPMNFNPADFFVQMLAIAPGEEEECRERVKKICDEFAVSTFNKQYTALQNDSKDEDDEAESFPVIQKCPYKASWIAQMRALLWRSFLSLRREPVLTKMRMTSAVIIALLLSAVYWQQELDQEGIQNLNGVSYFMITNMTFTTIIASVTAFCSELPMFLREHKNGMYRTDTYFLAKSLVEIPLFVIIGIVFSTIIYWSVGLQQDTVSYIVCVVIICLVANAACSFGYLVSCISETPGMAIAIAGPLLYPLALFGGFFLNNESIPIYFIWAKYLSWYHYANEALMINQWNNVDSISCSNHTYCRSNGEMVLQSMNFTQDHFYRDIAMLVVLLVGFRCLALLALSAKAHYRK